ncbi:MAG: SRPBCC family protein [Beijerinckiaceae bacterium]
MTVVDILHKVAAKASTDAFYGALTTIDGLAGWWTNNTQGEARIGSVITFRFGTLGFFAMKVLEMRPASRVVWEVQEGPPDWTDTQIIFDLKQEGEYAIVLFRHAGWNEASEGMHHCSTKWAVFMLSLKALVETGKGQPAPGDIKIDNWN